MGWMAGRPNGHGPGVLLTLSTSKDLDLPLRQQIHKSLSAIETLHTMRRTWLPSSEGIVDRFRVWLSIDRLTDHLQPLFTCSSFIGPKKVPSPGVLGEGGLGRTGSVLLTVRLLLCGYVVVCL